LGLPALQLHLLFSSPPIHKQRSSGAAVRSVGRGGVEESGGSGAARHGGRRQALSLAMERALCSPGATPLATAACPKASGLRRCTYTMGHCALLARDGPAARVALFLYPASLLLTPNFGRRDSHLWAQVSDLKGRFIEDRLI